jgi:flagellar biosynthesis/type III secretory pathway chaperone
MKNRLQTDVAAAVNALVRGYTEEALLYRHVRRLTWEQSDTLYEGRDLDQFQDLLDEKEDLLQMIEQIESGLREAKTRVSSNERLECPVRPRLNALLDRLIQIIAEIRAVESDNASFLSGIPDFSNPSP